MVKKRGEKIAVCAKNSTPFEVKIIINYQRDSFTWILQACTTTRTKIHLARSGRKEQIFPCCRGAARSCDQFHVALYIFTTVARVVARTTIARKSKARLRLRVVGFMIFNAIIQTPLGRLVYAAPRKRYTKIYNVTHSSNLIMPRSRTLGFSISWYL